MGQRLLLVDSDRSFLKDHQVSLEAAFEVDYAGSHEEAMRRLELGGYAAALVSVEVSENRGYALCSTIRRNPATQGVKVLLISAKATPEEFQKHQRTSTPADQYLHKPIAPAELVAALMPYVPPREVNPDSPLGDLVDGDFGEDWLDGLKHQLDTELEVPIPDAHAASLSTAPVPILSAFQPPKEEDPSVTRKFTKRADDELAAAQQIEIERLQEELRVRDQRLHEAEGELDQIKRQMSSVTQNLDDLERRRAEAETLRGRLEESEAALKRLESAQSGDTDNLRAQLKEAMTERQELLHQVEALNQQLAEKTQRTIDLLKEKDRLQHLNLEMDGRLQEMDALAQALESTGRERDEAARGRDEAARERDAAAQERDLLAQEHAALAEVRDAQAAELKQAHETRAVQAAEIDELKAATQDLEGRLQAAEARGARLEEAEARLKEAEARILDVETALERMRAESAGRAERIVSLQEEARVRESEMAGLQSRLDESLARIAALEAAEADARQVREALDAELGQAQAEGRRLEGELAASRAEATSLGEQLATERRNLEEAQVQHHQELDSLRTELQQVVDRVRGEWEALRAELDEKEEARAQLEALAQELDAKNGALADTVRTLEADGASLRGELDTLKGRTAKLAELLQELADRAQRGATLAQG